MFCTNCGAKMPDYARFCMRCGTPMVMPEPEPIPEPVPMKEPEPVPAPVWEPIPVEVPAAEPFAAPQWEPIPEPAPAEEPVTEPFTAPQWEPVPAEVPAAPVKAPVQELHWGPEPEIITEPDWAPVDVPLAEPQWEPVPETMAEPQPQASPEWGGEEQMDGVFAKIPSPEENVYVSIPEPMPELPELPPVEDFPATGSLLRPEPAVPMAVEDRPLVPEPVEVPPFSCPEPQRPPGVESPYSPKPLSPNVQQPIALWTAPAQPVQEVPEEKKPRKKGWFGRK